MPSAPDAIPSPAPWRGSLFAQDFLGGPLTDSPAWKGLGDGELAAVAAGLREIVERFPQRHQPNEATTEDELIWPVLQCLGWRDVLRQQRLSSRGREDVPDGLLFANDGAKTRALEQEEEWQRYGHGVALVESKRWGVGLDRSSDQQRRAPAGQVLRYLRHADDLTHGALRWGILSNGQRWRLYYAGARSVAAEFFEMDLPEILRDHNRDGLKCFVLLLRPQAFMPGVNGQSLHEFILSEGRRYEERVAANLSDMVFHQVFPKLAKALAAAAEEVGQSLAEPSSLAKVRTAALTLLYRLLFILYAEDRGLLPVRNLRYNDYSLRKQRDEVKSRKDAKDVFSTQFCRYWSHLQDLCQAIDQGDPSIGLPPYNGGLFNAAQTPLLAAVSLNDQVMADVLAALSFDHTTGGYINYRDLSVEQLGSIYERLLENELVHQDGTIMVQPNVFARKKSGSYYTPDALVRLIIKETLAPLVEDRSAEEILALKICDPAMGSGHFLVSLVDYLSDRVIEAMAATPEDEEAETHGATGLNGGTAPVAERVAAIRTTIRENARRGGWELEESQLDDRHIVRRLVLKRCVYGVDKNPMAVELAKVSLWLHTFTAGAPLSFLDHHLRCGNSLFGCWVEQGIERAMAADGPVLLAEPLRKAREAAEAMKAIEELSDTEIEEASHSACLFAHLQEATAPLTAFLSLVHGLQWLDLRQRADQITRQNILVGVFGNPIDLALNQGAAHPEAAPLLKQVWRLVAQERFFHWQVAFPGLWRNWDGTNSGGFDAVIGNPPWEQVKLQQVEWFAARRPEIAKAQRAADRKRLIQALKTTGDPLASAFAQAEQQANATARMARSCGDYPLLSRGDVNFYPLFVERAMALVKPQGMVGLLVPSGIASDKTAARFFRSVATEGRLRALYDFENKKVFFPEVHSRFKFCAFIASASATAPPSATAEHQPTPAAVARCGFFLHSTAELNNPDRCFSLTTEDFARVNPNTGTAPIFRSRRDAELTIGIYQRVPVLVDRSTGEEKKAWPVKYVRMFDMTNDSHLFRTKEELEEREGAFLLGGNRFGSPTGEWVPLYEGKMVQAFDHRAASIIINPANVHRPAQPTPATIEQHADPNWLPNPQYWVLESQCGWSMESGWVLGFKEITAPTNVRTLIAAILPAVGFGNKVPVLKPEASNRSEWLLAANLNATVFDFATRQKIQGQTLNLFILEQLPVVPPKHYETTGFGPKTAAKIVKAAVLELTYTAHDMAPFARDMGHVDEAGAVLPPFTWDETRRLHLRAKLDALFFHLYGITNRDDVRYIYSTFPIVERQDQDTYGCYRSRDLCLAYMNALAAGQPDVVVEG